MIDFVRNWKTVFKVLPKPLIIRLAFLTCFTLTILYFRLKIQNFESPTFRSEDNPAAFAKYQMTRTLTQHYLYFLNFWLLILPSWLAYDWSMNSIELVRDFNDFRVIFILSFYVLLISLTFVGLKKR